MQVSNHLGISQLFTQPQAFPPHLPQTWKPQGSCSCRTSTRRGAEEGPSFSFCSFFSKPCHCPATVPAHSKVPRNTLPILN